MPRPLSSFSLPLSFDRRAEVALLHRRCGRADLAWRLWQEWANQRQRYRGPLRAAPDVPVDDIDWAAEDIAYVIESFVDWRDTGALMIAAIDVGLFQVVEREGHPGRWLELTGYWEYNDHLDPHFQTVSQQGGFGKSLKHSHRAAARTAKQALALAEKQAQGELLIPDGQTRAEREAALALIIEIDRALALPARQSFDETEIADAIAVNRALERKAIEARLRDLMGRRDDPALVKLTARQLRDWVLVA